MKRLFLFCLLLTSSLFAQSIPAGFVEVHKEIPTIQFEMRYYSSSNFIGDTISGYSNNVLILTRQATAKLKEVQKKLSKDGLGLKVYDAYRPQRAVNHFWNWALMLNDTVMKAQYYPNVDKKDLFDEGYIAKQSSHTRGSTVDVTLIDQKTGVELDMGSAYDYFGKESWVKYKGITKQQRRNRKKLQKAMMSNGFKNYAKEWWHFTLKDEPFPDTYFDFEIK